LSLALALLARLMGALHKVPADRPAEKRPKSS